ncbi:MAG: CDP-diacylglycerol--glycerol-3-phosphate 3-phosphatidyltransferase [Pseudomonadales bacterium]|jgi:CDP-diacylglycerol---glycerol-3-phosphate 3-phosphatidyltransferase|nr:MULTISPECIES: CDP-diacylglycerol--glycerol-3-phosphate 3-phosphatidyltransferase [unclassified Ketobacter]MAQ23562.1 CDP-diacylglycerol--glycerol-3-phosphate 3-phosphatidyltransferase [Pseudomonadales bacterium]RLT90071.1 MAG: CDP-diacylglycerol--glycerol-3-phosphate 3-phosphatidyltransferase [Ketobacter sp. GenoA1]RLT99082.1 MAG: CDP-diacylglycerol--glycerol-3-phosphate 3-phosphatidyltransferase [Ketobacter sp.]HAU12800.1 CDP-diacylglycerol--glycerol-3-phosphate 3-phosphatidyltransferase [G|tara:strand:+ start:539 stop:1117 length:579 start_codon:yes stop_codon:yes gene_type:complete
MQQVAGKSTFLTVPNVLTLLRIALIPVFVGVFYLPYQWSALACAVIFAVAGITDWVDGYLARKMEQSTKLGAFLDPVADKLMVAAALVLLVEAHATALLAIPAIVIISREITVSALREWMAELGKRASVAVSFVGKVKTTVQMIAITGLLANEPDMQFWVVWLAYLLLYLATGLTLWSMMMYLKAAWPDLKE